MTQPQPPTGRLPTRERIVEIAIDLFSRQGYRGTSLRQIADRLGITKAAIYYHFHTKQDIARVIVTRALEVQEGMADRLVVAGTDPGAWQRAFPQVIDLALRGRRLLTALERNEDTFTALFADDPAIGGHLTDEGATIATLLANPTVDPALRVRLGALIGPLIFFADYYEDIPGDELRAQLNRAMVALMNGLPDSAAPR